MRKSGSLSLVVIVLIALGALTYTLTAGGRTPQLGLDLQGGTSVVLAPKEGQPAASGSLDQAISIIRRRLDGLGVAEPEITRQGDFIVVSLPGVKDQQRAIDLVGRTAKLQFRPVCQAGVPLYQPDAVYDSLLDPKTGGSSIAGCLEGANAATNPSSPTTLPADSPSVTADTVPLVPGSTPTSAADPGSSQSGLGAGSTDGHLALAQTPASDPATSTTVAVDPNAATTTAPADTGSTTTAPANEFPCGKAGEAAPDAPNDKPIVAVEDRDKNGQPDFCDVLGPVA